MIGAFVVGALALAVTALLLIGGGQLFRDRVELVAFFPGSVNGLSVGAPVKFKGVQIGRVSKILFAVDEAYRTDFHIPVFFELDPARMTRHGAVVTADDLRDKGILEDLYESGMRAQLVPESIVTGVLYVELDVHPGTEYRLHLDEDSDLREMPTLPTAFEQATSAAKQVLAKLEELDLDGLIRSISDTFEDIQKLFASPELKAVIENLNQVLNEADEAVVSVRRLADSARGDVDNVSKSLDQTLAKSRETLANVDRTLADASATLEATTDFVEPESPIVYQLSQTMRSIDEAARAVRQLSDTIERNPSSIVYGRPGEGR